MGIHSHSAALMGKSVTKMDLILSGSYGNEDTCNSMMPLFKGKKIPAVAKNHIYRGGGGRDPAGSAAWKRNLYAILKLMDWTLLQQSLGKWERGKGPQRNYDNYGTGGGPKKDICGWMARAKVEPHYLNYGHWGELRHGWNRHGNAKFRILADCVYAPLFCKTETPAVLQWNRIDWETMPLPALWLSFLLLHKKMFSNYAGDEE